MLLESWSVADPRSALSWDIFPNLSHLSPTPLYLIITYFYYQGKPLAPQIPTSKIVFSFEIYGFPEHALRVTLTNVFAKCLNSLFLVCCLTIKRVNGAHVW